MTTTVTIYARTENGDKVRISVIDTITGDNIEVIELEDGQRVHREVDNSKSVHVEVLGVPLTAATAIAVDKVPSIVKAIEKQAGETNVN
jgi:hypothetical protein